MFENNQIEIWKWKGQKFKFIAKSLIKYEQFNLIYSLKEELVEKRGWKIVNILLVEDVYKILNSDLRQKENLHNWDWEAALGEEKKNGKKKSQSTN